MIESIVTDASYAFGNSKGISSTIIESFFANCGYTFRNSESGHFLTTFEGIVTDACYAFRDSDGFQAVAANEGIVTDSCYSLRNSQIRDFLVVQIQMS